MSGHVSISLIDLRLIARQLGDGDFGIVGYKQMGHTRDRFERTHMSVNPIRKRLRPTCLSVEKAGSTKHGDEDLRYSDFAGRSVDNNRHAITG